MTEPESRVPDQTAEKAETSPKRGHTGASGRAGSFVLIVLIGVATAGFFVAYQLLEHSPDTKKFAGHHAEFELWADLAGVMVGFALAAMLVMSTWLRHVLRRFHPFPYGHLALWVGELAFVFVILGFATHWYSSSDFAQQTAQLHQTE